MDLASIQHLFQVRFNSIKSKFDWNDYKHQLLLNDLLLQLLPDLYPSSFSQNGYVKRIILSIVANPHDYVAKSPNDYLTTSVKWVENWSNIDQSLAKLEQL